MYSFLNLHLCLPTVAVDPVINLPIVYPAISLSIFRSTDLCVHISVIHLYLYLSIYLSTCLFIHESIYPCLSICLSIDVYWCLASPDACVQQPTLENCTLRSGDTGATPCSICLCLLSLAEPLQPHLAGVSLTGDIGIGSPMPRKAQFPSTSQSMVGRGLHTLVNEWSEQPFSY